MLSPPWVLAPLYAHSLAALSLYRATAPNHGLVSHLLWLPVANQEWAAIWLWTFASRLAGLEMPVGGEAGAELGMEEPSQRPTLQHYPSS